MTSLPLHSVPKIGMISLSPLSSSSLLLSGSSSDPSKTLDSSVFNAQPRSMMAENSTSVLLNTSAIAVSLYESGEGAMMLQFTFPFSSLTSTQPHLILSSPRNHLTTPPSHHLITSPPCCLVTLSPHHLAALSPCHLVTSSLPCHLVTSTSPQPRPRPHLILILISPSSSSLTLISSHPRLISYLRIPLSIPFLEHCILPSLVPVL